ncbi:DNA mismatch repair protein MutS, partial [gut metagenome]
MTTPQHEKDIDLNDYTPAMRQYIEVKRRYPETLILFRMGDFYETFFDDAVKANRLIGITLTKRGKMKNGDPIPMAGIPMVSLDQYVARLVRLGESVVIAEQQGVPGKGLMERKISRIITPGTLTDTSLLPEKNDAILLAISRENRKDGRWGFVWLTLSNGDFRASLVSDDQFESELARIAPSELLVTDRLRDDIRTNYPEITVTPMPSWHFDAEHGVEKL